MAAIGACLFCEFCMDDIKMDWLTRIIVGLILVIGALYIVSLWNEDIESKNSYVFARERIGQIRSEMADK